MVAATLTLLAAACPAPTHAAPVPVFEPCELTGTNGAGLAEAECTVFEVPENAAQPQGTSIGLFVARIRSTAVDPETDALTLINGGPGGASTELYTDLAGVFAPVLNERDILVVDQRGTGRSNPLECPDLDSMVQDSDTDAIAAATRRCVDNLAGDPRFYTTSVAVGDLERVREALGYPTLDVYGVSYGTRVGLHYLRRYPEHVRSLIIDGVVPPNVVLGANVALNAQAALNGIFSRCRDQPACADRFNSPDRMLGSLRAHLSHTPVPIEINDALTGQPQTFEFSYQHLAVAIRMLSYAPETAALIPLLLDQAYTGRYEPIASHAHRIVNRLTGMLSFGMHNSVVCTEDAPYFDDAAVDWTALRDSYLGADQYTALKTICALWPRGVMDEDFHEPVTGGAPVLVMSGQYDPITPVEYGERVHAQLANSVHVVAPGQGHGIIARGCVPSLVAGFIRDPRPRNVDASCTARMRATPFFVNAMGPVP